MVRSFHDVVAWFDLDSDRVFRQDLDENLHSASQAKNTVKYWPFLDVVVAQSCFPAKMSRCWRPRGMPSLSWMFLFTFKYCLLVQPQEYCSFQLGSSRRTAWCFETCIFFHEINGKNFLCSKTENEWRRRKSALFSGRHGGRSWYFLLRNFIAFQSCVSPAQHTFLIGESHRNVRSVCVTASAVFSPAFSEIFTVQREIVFSHVEEGIVLFFQTHPPPRILWRAHTLPHWLLERISFHA